MLKLLIHDYTPEKYRSFEHSALTKRFRMLRKELK